MMALSLFYISETAYLISIVVVSEGTCSLGEIANDCDDNWSI